MVYFSKNASPRFKMPLLDRISLPATSDQRGRHLPGHHRHVRLRRVLRQPLDVPVRHLRIVVRHPVGCRQLRGKPWERRQRQRWYGSGAVKQCCTLVPENKSAINVSATPKSMLPFSFFFFYLCSKFRLVPAILTRSFQLACTVIARFEHAENLGKGFNVTSGEFCFYLCCRRFLNSSTRVKILTVQTMLFMTLKYFKQIPTPVTQNILPIVIKPCCMRQGLANCFGNCNTVSS